jgi:hypothetical protein
LRCAIPLFVLQFVPKYQKCVNFARGRVHRIWNTQPHPHKKLFQQREAVPCHVRLRAFLRLNVIPPPHDALFAAQFRGEKAASALDFEAVPPATVAIPRGTAGRLLCSSYKMERDDQFFLCSSLRAHSALTAESASLNNSSGPLSINDSAVAGSPSISSPRTSSSPQRR